MKVHEYASGIRVDRNLPSLLWTRSSCNRNWSRTTLLVALRSSSLVVVYNSDDKVITVCKIPRLFTD